MKLNKLPITTLLLALVILPGLPCRASSDHHQPATPGASAAASPESTEAVEEAVPEYFVMPPPLSDGIFPCSECHADMEANPNRRELEEHTEIAKSFNHARQERWCLDCHNPDDRDKLRLANGTLIDFDKSYYLCGQCHGTIFRDWKAGVHGKRTGEWNGKKIYRLCVQCHNPHHPRFAPLTPMPPPTPPAEITLEKLAPAEIPRNPLGNLQ